MSLHHLLKNYLSFSLIHFFSGQAESVEQVACNYAYNYTSQVSSISIASLGHLFNV